MCAYNNQILQLLLVATPSLLQSVVQAASYVDVLDLPARPSASNAVHPLNVKEST